MQYCGQCGNELEEFRDEEERERKRCRRCDWTWFNNPVPVVLVVAVADDGRIVYTRQHDWPSGFWGLIAGYIEQGETAEMAALREVEEECGVEAYDPHYISSFSFRGQLVMAFTVRLSTGEVRAGSDVDLIDLAKPDPGRPPAGTPARVAVEKYLASRL